MQTIRKPDPLVVCAVSGADDEALDICKAWVKEQGFTNDTHRIMRGQTMTWVEEKICQKQMS